MIVNFVSMTTWSSASALEVGIMTSSRFTAEPPFTKHKCHNGQFVSSSHDSTMIHSITYDTSIKYRKSTNRQCQMTTMCWQPSYVVVSLADCQECQAESLSVAADRWSCRNRNKSDVEPVSQPTATRKESYPSPCQTVRWDTALNNVIRFHFMSAAVTDLA